MLSVFWSSPWRLFGYRHKEKFVEFLFKPPPPLLVLMALYPLSNKIIELFDVFSFFKL
jgi:hypothetical protein